MNPTSLTPPRTALPPLSEARALPRPPLESADDHADRFDRHLAFSASGRKDEPAQSRKSAPRNRPADRGEPKSADSPGATLNLVASSNSVATHVQPTEATKPAAADNAATTAAPAAAAVGASGTGPGSATPTAASPASSADAQAASTVAASTASAPAAVGAAAAGTYNADQIAAVTNASPGAATAAAATPAVSGGKFVDTGRAAPGAGRNAIVSEARLAALANGASPSTNATAAAPRGARATTPDATQAPAAGVAPADTPPPSAAAAAASAVSIQQILAATTAVQIGDAAGGVAQAGGAGVEAGNARAANAVASTSPPWQPQPADQATFAASNAVAASALPAALARAAMSAEGRGADTQSKADREGDSVDAVLGVSSAAPLSYAEAATADGKTAAPPVRDPQFADVLGARLSWLAERHIGSAQITVSPRSMGSIDVRLQLDGERVRAAFSSPNAEVRHAIESHLPRLRELLSTSGFTLTDAQIGGGAQQQLPSPPQHVPTGDSADPVAPITVTPTAPPRAAEGRLLDEFA